MSVFRSPMFKNESGNRARSEIFSVFIYSVQEKTKGTFLEARTMRSLDSLRFEVVIVAVAISILANGQIAKADFFFGIPTHLGSEVNGPENDGTPSISTDGLSLYFNSQRSGGYGHFDVWVVTRDTIDAPWGEPLNLGPGINTSSMDGCEHISADGLTLHFTSQGRPEGYGDWDIYVTTRASLSDPWGIPVNLGPVINTSARDGDACLSADGLMLFFDSTRSGGSGANDMYMAARVTTADPWGEPVNLGTTVNGSAVDACPNISADGLMLFFMSNREGGHGAFDIWVTTRATTEDDWGIPVNLGPGVNGEGFDGTPNISSDGSTLYFMSDRPGGLGKYDLWEVSINPIVDLNSDGIVDAADMSIMVDFWGTDEPSCDIGPMPWGDGIVDIEDLKVLAEHLFEEFPPAQ